MGQEIGAFITVFQLINNCFKITYFRFLEEEYLQLYFVLLKLALCDHLALNCFDRKHYAVYLFITCSHYCYDEASRIQFLSM